VRKLEEGEASATFLAVAGLNRLGMQSHIRAHISPDDMLPAVAQGAIGIECRADRADVMEMISRISHAPTMTCLTAERAFLRELDGSCRTPIAGLAELNDGQLRLRGEVLSLDGTIRHLQEISGPAGDAEKLGVTLGKALRSRAGEALLTHG
jgi:hydroxymethylbilane synthase